MALTIVKYRKTPTGEATAVTPVVIKSRSVQQQFQQVLKKPLIKLEGASGLVINKIPAVIKPALKRSNPTTADSNTALKSSKGSLQTVASTGTPLTSFQWQQTIGGSGGTTITTASKKAPSQLQQQQHNLAKSISNLPPNTIIQATNSNTPKLSLNSNAATANGVTITPSFTTIPITTVNNSSSGNSNVVQMRRPTFFLKPKRSIRSVTLELIEKNPFVHLGINLDRLPLLKNVISVTTEVPQLECYLVLKKLRQNEDFSLLAQYFELSETEVQQVFSRGVVRLARYLRYLIRWPDSKRYYDRHKNLPFAFRANLSHVQSLIECVETDMQCPSVQIDCNNYKFILSIMPNGVISYVSEAYVGHHDDLTIFAAANFNDVIPKYLSMVVDPGKGIRRKPKIKQKILKNKTRGGDMSMETDSTTDSAEESVDDETDDTDDGRSMSRYAATRVAGEFASHHSLSIVNNELISQKAKDISISTVHIREPVCRLQMRQMLETLREYKVLQPCAIQEPLLYQFLNEILVVCAALTNLQR